MTEQSSNGAAPSEATARAESKVKIDLGLTERRKIIRPIPAADAVESNADADWALFQELSKSAMPSEPDQNPQNN